MKKNKVKLAVFDKTRKCEIKQYPISSDGTKILIDEKDLASNPEFGANNFLYLPKPLGMGYDQIYFVPKGSVKCLNFETGEIHGPDPDAVKRAARAEIMRTWGQDTPKTPILQYLTFIVLFIILLIEVGALS